MQAFVWTTTPFSRGPFWTSSLKVFNELNATTPPLCVWWPVINGDVMVGISLITYWCSSHGVGRLKVLKKLLSEAIFSWAKDWETIYRYWKSLFLFQVAWLPIIAHVFNKFTLHCYWMAKVFSYVLVKTLLLLLMLCHSHII